VLVSSGVHAAPLTVVSWGGSYGDAQDAALFDDASKNTGIEILRESGASMSKTCLQVQSGSVTWDLVVTGSGGGASAAADGCLEKIDFDVVDVSDFYPDTYTDYCVGSDIFATVMAWNTDKFGKPGSDNAPKTWADFWDVEKFPGTRAYRANNVDGALEPALMADGVPPDQVYEVLSTEGGMKRALDKIRELKPHIAVFWDSGAMQAQLMKDAEVDFTTGWNGRFDNAKKDGATVGYSLDQAVVYTNQGNSSQTFHKNGETTFVEGRPSLGYWRVDNDQYCSQWPPSSTWACYDVYLNAGGNIVRFQGSDGVNWDGTYR